MIYNLFDKKNSGERVNNEIISDKELAEALRKPVIRKFDKIKSTLTFYRQNMGRGSSRYAIDK